MQVEQISHSHKEPEHLRLLYKVTDMLRQSEADSLNISVILPRVLSVASVELDASTGSIIIIDPDHSVEYSWNVDGDESYQTHYIPFIEKVMAQGIAGLATRTHQSIKIDSTLNDPRWLHRPNHATTHEPWSAICTPLIVRGRAIGAITITKPGIAQFDSSDVDLLDAISSQAAINIENARLYTTTQRQLKESELFNAASKAINSSLDVNKIMQSMLSQMNELLNAEAISVALVEASELVFTVADGAGSEDIVGLRLPSDQGIAGWVMEHAAPVLVNSPQDDPRRSQLGDERTGLRTEAIICAPLQARGQVLGTIQAINPPTGQFTQDDLRILARLASLASSAIDKSEQYRLTQEAESRYVNLFEDSIDPIIITTLDGVIREVNRRAVEFLGYGRHQLLGESIDVLHQGPVLSDVRSQLMSTAEKGRISISTQNVKTRMGDSIPVEVHAKRLYQSATSEFQWIYHDISKQVELEQMRNDLTAMLFHDLQNPLSNVISSLEILETDLMAAEDADPIAQMMITIAHRSSERLRHLIRSLLDINQLEAGAPVREQACVTVPEMFEYVSMMLEVPLQTKGLTLAKNIEDGIPALYLNKDMIDRVIINLLDNAVKFSKRGDTLTVGARFVDNKQFVELSVSDEGPGIPAQYRKSIFGKFYRTPNNTSKGIGLGLAFCRLAVEAHGGTIWASEADGGGARFNFTIPVGNCD